MPMKLPNGYGSVTKLSGNRRNPYMARVTLGRDDYGQLVRKTLGYYHTRKEALAALAEYNRDPYDLSADKITFSEIYAMWAERHSQTVSHNTMKQYARLYAACAPIADKPMADLKLVHLQTLVDNAGLSPIISKQLKSLLNQIYQLAINREIVTVNYAERIELDKKPETKKPHIPFTHDEISALWTRVDVSTVQYALILIYTGMRAGELINMRTADVHIDDGYMIGGSKTAAGKNRIIPIHHKIAPLIANFYNPNNDYLITPRITGFKLHYYFERDIPGHRTHDCRHTFASLMDEAGANRSALKRIMGHAGGDVTDSVYIHKTVSDLKRAVELISV